MSRKELEEQRDALPLDQDGSRTLLAMNIDSLLSLNADDYSFSIVEDEGDFEVRIEARIEETCINHTTAPMQRVPLLTKKLAESGAIKEAFEVYRIDRLNDIEAARSQLFEWL